MYFSDMLKIWTRALRVRSGEIGLFFDLWVDSFSRQSRTEIRLFAFLSAHDVLVVPWLVFPHIPPRICSELFSPFHPLHATLHQRRRKYPRGSAPDVFPSCTKCMYFVIHADAHPPEDPLRTLLPVWPMGGQVAGTGRQANGGGGQGGREEDRGSERGDEGTPNVPNLRLLARSIGWPAGRGPTVGENRCQEGRK